MSRPRTRVVLFDLGGVLVELGGVETFSRWIDEPDEEEVWRRWLACPWVRRFERGQCNPAEFAQGMVEAWNLALAPDDFLEQFRAWPRGLYPGALALLHALDGRIRRACFSNTNELHWEHRFGDFGLHQALEATYLSYRLGVVKPDREAFEHVVADLAVEPGEILFLDDNRINVEGARAVGIDAARVEGPEAARQVLARRGLLDG